MRIGQAVDIAVEGAVGHRAQIERRGSERPKLSPPEMPRRIPGQTDERTTKRLGPGRDDGLTVAPGAGASHRVVADPGRLIHDERGERALFIEDADAGREPWNPPRGVRGAVDGVEHREQRATRRVGTEAGLLAQHAEAGRGEHPDRGLVGDEVGAVLAGRVPASPQSSSPRREPATASTASPRTLRSSAPSMARTVMRRLARERSPKLARWMAVIDVAGYVAELKDHAVDHGFHVHDERHFVETYSLRQFWEVDLHPEEGCGGPIDLHLALEVEPRVLLDFEDAVVALPDDDDPPDKWSFPLTFNWGIPPLPKGPDLLRLAIDLAGVGGVELPLEISATDSFGSVTDPPVRRLTIVARQQVSLARVLAGEELLCDTFDRALGVSRFLLDNAPIWLGE